MTFVHDRVEFRAGCLAFFRWGVEIGVFVPGIDFCDGGVREVDVGWSYAAGTARWLLRLGLLLLLGAAALVASVENEDEETQEGETG